jgi:hypothetical protein
LPPDGKEEKRREKKKGKNPLEKENIPFSTSGLVGHLA